MSTSLSEQLQRLSVPQTSLLKNGQNRASLIFHTKEAAEFRRDTLYQIGLEGLEELILINPIFQQFQDTLFHVASINFNRSVKHKDANDKLNKVINKFLLMASPYFLLNSVHKSLEWLITRYMINEFHREELLMLILPYHESNIFLRIVHTLKFEDRCDPWYFLKTVQTPGIHLLKHILLNHAAHSVAFIKFVEVFLNQLLVVHEKPNILTVAFNFYCTMYSGAIEYSSELTEDQVLQMLPLILKGLNSSIPDFAAASFIITARLLVKTTLSKELLNSFVEKLSQVKCDNLKIEVTLLMLVIYQSQQQYSYITPLALTNLSENEWIPRCLQYHNLNGNNIYPFLEVLIKYATDEGTNNDLKLLRDFVIALLDEIKLDDLFVGSSLCAILDVLDIKLKYSNDANQWLSSIVQKLEAQYPSTFDQHIFNLFSCNSTKKCRKRKACLKRILENTISYKSKFDIFNKIYHPREELRGEAIKYLTKNFLSLKKCDQELIKYLIVDRLHDDRSNVVKETLSLLSKTNISKHVFFEDALIRLIQGKTILNDEWKNVLFLATHLLCAERDFNWAIFILVFPLLILYSKKHFKDVKNLLGLRFFSKSKIFNGFFDKLTQCHDEKQFLGSILHCLSTNGTLEIVNDFLLIYKKNIYTTKYVSQFCAAIILSSILPEQCLLETSVSAFQFYYEMYTCFKQNICTKQLSEYDCIKICLNNKFPLEGFKKCIEKTLAKTKFDDNWISIDFFYKTKKTTFLQLTCSLVFSIFTFDNLSEIFVKQFCGCIHETVDSLLNLSASGCLSNFSNYNILNYLLQLLKTNDTIEKIIGLERLTTPYLLALLNNQSKEVRNLVLNIMEIIVNRLTRKTECYFYLLEGLLKHRKEIMIDNEQTSIIIFNLLAPANTIGKNYVKELDTILSTLLQVTCNDQTPSYIKALLLKALSHINNLFISESLSKAVLDYFKNCSTITGYQSLICVKMVNRVDMSLMPELSLHTNTWRFIEFALRNENIQVELNTDLFFLSVLLLNQLTIDVLSEAPEEILERLLEILCEISTTSQNSQILSLSSRIFKHIDLDAKLILKQLGRMRDFQSSKQETIKKKRIVSVVPTEDILDSLDWKKGVCILEFLQEKKKIRNCEFLLSILFDILKKCLDFEEQARVEYPKQLILSLIMLISSKIENEKNSEIFFNIELIIQCIRASQNPQTHHHALLVLANTAQLVPNQVLHHIMTIFTFMGSSLLRHDDAYSFQIIAKIIDTIIPILVKHDHIGSVSKVLRVFVDALLDIPEHRRIPLYKQLLNRINARENLYLFLLLVFESQVLYIIHEKPKSIKGSNISPKRLDIVVTLCQDFTPDIVIDSCIKLINYLKELPDEKEEVAVENESVTFNFGNYTDKQFRHYTYIIVKFVTKLLSSKQFVNTIAILNKKDCSNLEELYKELIINTLTYIQHLQKVAEQASDTSHAHYWKVVLHHSYDILDSINALLTSRMFLLVVKGLMKHNIVTVKRRALELLNTKLQYNSQIFNNCDIDEMFVLIPPIIIIIESIHKDPLEGDQEILVQTALLSLKLLVKALAPKHPEKFVEILRCITNLVISGKAQYNVLASVILCLAELCVELKGHAVSCLSNFMPSFLKILKNQKHQDTSNLLLLSVITAVQKLLDSLSLFLSPYLNRIIFEIAILISKWGINTNDPKVLSFANKLNGIKHKIGTLIPSRILIPAIAITYNNLIKKMCFKAVGALMDILSESVKQLKLSDIKLHMQELTNLFLKALEFRSESSSTLYDVNQVENQIIIAIVQLILKLSESSFKQFYYKLYDWATKNGKSNDRIITFYNLSVSIARSLKGLFVLFADNFLTDASQILRHVNKLNEENYYFVEREKNIILLECVLGTLETIFINANHTFINRDRFDILMQPLIDQLENNIDGVEALVKRNHELLTPTIVNFALAVDDDSLCKQINYQILLKLRNPVPEIRLVALHCLTKLVAKLGEDFLPLLPETIPFLAELLEDEEEIVENACQKAINEIEKILGEPLQKYF